MRLSQLVCTTPALLLFIFFLCSRAKILALVDLLLSPLRVRMHQNTPHHLINLLAPLLVEDLLLVSPKSVQNQPFNVFSSSFSKPLPCLPDLVRTKPLQAQTFSKSISLNS